MEVFDAAEKIFSVCDLAAKVLSLDCFVHTII